MKLYKMVIVCTIRDVINLKLDAAKSICIIWTTGINGPHHFALQKFGDTLYKYFLAFRTASNPLNLYLCFNIISIL